MIDFPGNGSRYSNNMNCKWTISRNYSYVLKFHQFDLEWEWSGAERSGNCFYDYLQLGRGGKKKCGNLVPDELFVRRTTELIFHSDHSVTGGGFKIEIIKNEAGMLSLF